MKGNFSAILGRGFYFLKNIFGGATQKKMRDIKPLFYLYQVYKFLIIYVFLVLSLIFVTLLSLTLSVFKSERLFQVGGILWGRFNGFITPMLVSTEGKENVDKKQSYIVVANHLSLYDIYLIYGWLPVDFRWVMKQELRKVPILGFFCYRAGHVFINRSNPESARSSINAAKERIKDGTSIFFFPEGTRSNDERLLPFKKGAFKLAIDMNLPILPVTIVGTQDILPNNTTDLFPGKAKLIIHKPIDINNYNDNNIQALIDRAQTIIQEPLL